nr:YjbF family lipoprotein [Gemmobacter fulvus]
MKKNLVRIGFLAAALTLAACGNDDRGDIGVQQFGVAAKAALQAQRAARSGPPPEPSRAELAAFKQPILEVSAPTGTLLLVPLSRRDGAVIWSTSTKQTVMLREDQIRATRGFGTADLMEATGPGAAQISAASKGYARSYTVLDGADQVVRRRLTCNATAAGSERIVIKGLAYDTRVIRENCEGDGFRVENQYWFDGPSSIRQSRQYAGDVIGYVTLRRIID